MSSVMDERQQVDIPDVGHLTVEEVPSDVPTEQTVVVPLESTTTTTTTVTYVDMLGEQPVDQEDFEMIERESPELASYDVIPDVEERGVPSQQPTSGTYYSPLHYSTHRFSTFDFSACTDLERIIPVVKKPLEEDLRVMDGQALTLQCQFDVQPMQEATWFHEDQPVRENEDITIYQDAQGVCELCIAEVFPEDAGLYVCRLENVHGVAETRCQVTVEGTSGYAHYIPYHT